MKGHPHDPEHSAAKVRIYQLFLRLFGNAKADSRPHGSMAENGVGKFRDLNDSALSALRGMGFTHLWLLGMLRQATATDYSAFGLPPDDPAILKGTAGSPFAVRDVFDVCPDYATDPARRSEEFMDLVDRIHRHGLKVLVDFVPNHVARSHRSVVRPELELGGRDDRSRFFAPGNNFYYLEGEGPLRLPGGRGNHGAKAPDSFLAGGDGLFERETDHGKVTGNNLVSWNPGPDDWYETVKLNYGFDFRLGPHAPREYPSTNDPTKPIPDTWHKMDAVLAHWQGLGVDGFRCDMAHWIPLEFWEWAIARARDRASHAYFLAEAYDNDPNKLCVGNVLESLVRAGFDATYDDPSRAILKGIYDGPKWANDLDDLVGTVAPLHASLRYVENHDTVRLANSGHWGGVGMEVGRPLCAILFGLGRGPVLVHNGQEVGEPAIESAECRTSLFEYGSMPALGKWVNGHRYDGGGLTRGQRELRRWYGQLLKLLELPAFSQGEFLPLNPINNSNPAFGRLPGEQASGHWLYAFLRHDDRTGSTFLVVANLHPSQTFRNVEIWLSPEALRALDIERDNRRVTLVDRLGELGTTLHDAARLRSEGLRLAELPPLGASFLDLG